MPHIILLGTCDTKLDELLYLRAQILQQDSSSKVTLVDVGRSQTQDEAITVTQATLVTEYGPSEGQDISNLPRGDVIKHMIICASNWLREAYQQGVDDPSHAIHGIVSAGGTGGTSLAAGVMREAVPIGLPKLIVSTAASGDTGPIVGESDVTLMYSVVDIAGTNSLLKRILSNAAGAIHGMSSMYEKSLGGQDDQEARKRRIGLTMFGVTTPCVDTIRRHLESDYNVECFVFHCTGHGGLAMERLVQQGSLDAVLDITTTEICDYLVEGGVMSAGPTRLESALRAGIPCIISVGATDMVNFGPVATVPEKYTKAGRKLFEHNPTVTLMRTSPEECKAIGEFIVGKVREFAKDESAVKVMLPLGGVSMISTPGGPFYDEGADRALFEAISNGLHGSRVDLIKLESAINDDAFALTVVKNLVKMMGL